MGLRLSSLTCVTAGRSEFRILFCSVLFCCSVLRRHAHHFLKLKIQEEKKWEFIHVFRAPKNGFPSPQNLSVLFRSAVLLYRSSTLLFYSSDLKLCSVLLFCDSVLLFCSMQKCRSLWNIEYKYRKNAEIWLCLGVSVLFCSTVLFCCSENTAALFCYCSVFFTDNAHYFNII